MTQPNRLRRTRLHSFHLDQQANMAAFGGYHMPLWYSTGAKQEHLAVIERAGLFDTSHMGVLTVTGSGAFALLQHVFSRDLRRCIGGGPLSPGRCVYGLLPAADGTVLDDAVVSQLAPERFMVVVNSAMGPVVADHFRSAANGTATVADHTDAIGKVDLQGPAAALILESLLNDPDAVLGDMGYFSCKGDIFPGGDAGPLLGDGTPVIVSRTGYTGEFGFELYTGAEDVERLWRNLLRAGASYGLLPCGLAARDSLRTGAMLPLAHQDIGPWRFGRTPWSFVLPYAADGGAFTKNFIGADRLLEEDGDYTLAFAGYDPRKITPGQDSAVVTEQGETVGSLLTCTTDMAIDRVGERIVSVATPASAGRPADFRPRGLCCGFIRTSRPCAAGDQLLLSRGRRRLRVEIRDEIRPDRTARRPMERMRAKNT